MPSQQQAQLQQLPTGPTRWCSTPMQLRILKEMYRGGLRTPNASQIQQITAHLASYGRIEGKNVFYWFQNHRARDRKKLSRRLCMSHRLPSGAQYYAVHGGHGFLAPPTTLPVAPYGRGGVFDQAAAGQLLSPTSPTQAAAAAYGYYSPATTAFAAAAPASSATTPLSPNQLFYYHQNGGGVVPADAFGRPEYSLGKLDNFIVALDDVVSAAAAADMGPPGFEVAPPAAFCRPIKTLDLFPGGLKEEQSDVA